MGHRDRDRDRAKGWGWGRGWGRGWATGMGQRDEGEVRERIGYARAPAEAPVMLRRLPGLVVLVSLTSALGGAAFLSCTTQEGAPSPEPMPCPTTPKPMPA